MNHIDTADFYGPHVVNEIIREALAPYDGVNIVTKVGSVRDENGNWPHARSPRELREQVESNLKTLGVEALDVVNLRLGGGPDGHSPVAGSLPESFGALAELRKQGKIKHLGLSVVNADQVAEAQTIAPIVTVQNWYNVAHRGHEDLIAELSGKGVAYTAFWPLGGFNPLQSSTLDAVAARLDTTPKAIAIAWLLHRSPDVIVKGSAGFGGFRLVEDGGAGMCSSRVIVPRSQGWPAGHRGADRLDAGRDHPRLGGAEHRSRRCRCARAGGAATRR